MTTPTDRTNTALKSPEIPVGSRWCTWSLSGGPLVAVILAVTDETVTLKHWGCRPNTETMGYFRENYWPERKKVKR